MFHCERCGIRFSSGALSGSRDCPRCMARDGLRVPLFWEPAIAHVPTAVAAVRATPAQARPEPRQPA
jgi:predicted  nucleic acid-binding Zn-ribbon protein